MNSLELRTCGAGPSDASYSMEECTDACYSMEECTYWRKT